MRRTLLLLTPLALAACVSHWQAPPQGPDRAGPAPTLDPGTPDDVDFPVYEADRMVFLDQGLDTASRNAWYHTSQGTRLMSLRLFLGLENVEGTAPFNDESTWHRLRFLPRTKTEDNPHGLPVGIAVDLTDEQRASEKVKTLDPTGQTREEPYIGFSCAACHTHRLDAVTDQGRTAIIIDGGTGYIDVQSFNIDIAEAARRTLPDVDADRWERFVATVGGADCDDACRARLEAEVRADTTFLHDELALGHGALRPGFGRLDAVNTILNKISGPNMGKPENMVPPRIPAGYPALWDANYHDWMEWNGFGTNAGAGPMSRNVGQFFGIQGRVEYKTWTGGGPLPPGYVSSLRWRGIEELEEWTRTLTSPQWPEEILGEIDDDAAERGEAIYRAECLECHALVDRVEHVQVDPPLDPKRPLPGLTMRTLFVARDEIGTDPLFLENFLERRIATGEFAGEKAQGSNGNPPTLDEEVRGLVWLRHVVANTMFGSVPAVLRAVNYSQAEKRGGAADEPERHYVRTPPEDPYDAYRTRALNGVWATPPYLHTHTVVSIADLLLPPDERPTDIYLGTYDYDPERIGLKNTNVCPDAWNEPGSAWSIPEPRTWHVDPEQRAKNQEAQPDRTKCEAAGYHVRTSIPGNSAAGHEYGTTLPDEDKAALLEYIKTL